MYSATFGIIFYVIQYVTTPNTNIPIKTKVFNEVKSKKTPIIEYMRRM